MPPRQRSEPDFFPSLALTAIEIPYDEVQRNQAFKVVIDTSKIATKFITVQFLRLEGANEDQVLVLDHPRVAEGEVFVAFEVIGFARSGRYMMRVFVGRVKSAWAAGVCGMEKEFTVVEERWQQ